MKRLVFVLAALVIFIGDVAAQTPPTVRPCYGNPCVGVATGTPLPVTATITPSGTQNVNLIQLNSVALGSPSAYGTSPGAVNVPGVNAFVTNFPATQPISGTVTANQGTANATPWNDNIAQINGVTPLMGNGVTGTGSQRVTVASDNTAFTVNPTSATPPVSTMNSASANSGVTSAMAGVFDDVAPTAITENSFGYVRMSANRNQYTTLRDAAGNERGANVSAANELQVGSGTLATAANQTATQAPVAPATATATKSDLMGAQATTAAVNPTNGQQSALSSDTNNNLLVSAGGAPNLATSQASVTTGNISVASARALRRSITITNVTGTSAAFCGNTGVTTSTGAYLGATAGSSITLNTTAAVFCTVAATTQTVAVAETF